MLRRFFITSCALAMGTICAQAADLPMQSGIGKIFAEPKRPVKARVIKPVEHEDNSRLWIPRKVAGYYGRPTDFQQRSYYGTTKSFLYDYVPMVCEALSTCNTGDDQ